MGNWVITDSECDLPDPAHLRDAPQRDSSALTMWDLGHVPNSLEKVTVTIVCEFVFRLHAATGVL